MASVDSGVDTGNDSNDSFAQDKHSVAQTESQSNSVSTPVGSSPKDLLGTFGKIKPHCVVKCNKLSPFHMEPPAGLSFLHLQTLSFGRGYEIALQRLNSDYQNNKLISKLKPLSVKTRLTARHLLHDKSWMDFTKSRDENRLRLAAFMNDVDKVRQYLDAGVSPNCPDCQFRTPLHLSACNGYTDVVRLLLDRGANPNVKDMVGNTPLHLAVCTNHIDVVTLLLKAGTDASCYNITGRSPLQLAQSKLKIIQRSQDTEYKHQVTSQVIDMLLTFIKKKTEVTKNAVDEELLNAFQSRLQVSETQEQVETELQNLLDNLSSLSLSNSLPSSTSTSSAST